ncbi:MAG: ABC transporter permease [Chlamydiota bacterium]
MLFNILEQSFLFFPLALGLYISYAVLRIPDLTTDGSFVLGAALFGVSIHLNIHPVLSMGIATFGGALCGAAVSFLQTRFHLHPLIAGILLVFILNTLSLKLMGRPNLSLLDRPSIFSLIDPSKLLLLFSLTFTLLISAAFLLTSKTGVLLHALGNNPTLLNLFGKNANAYRMLGLCISNGLVGFSGALTAQANGYVDTSMGLGVVLIALGTVMIGQQIYQFLFANLPLKNILRLLSCLTGIFAYFFLINILISAGLDPIYLRLMIGLSLIGFLAITRNKKLQETRS